MPSAPSTPSVNGHDSDSEEWLDPYTEVGKCVVSAATTGEVLCEFPVDLGNNLEWISAFAIWRVKESLVRRRDARSSSRVRLLHGTRELNSPYGKLHELVFDGKEILAHNVVFEDPQPEVCGY